jgi:hypothetical protein
MRPSLIAAAASTAPGTGPLDVSVLLGIGAA